MEPVSELAPAENASTAPEEEGESIVKPVDLEETVQDAIETCSTTTTTSATSSNSSTRNKRRSQDEMVNTSNSKKPRRMSKMRGKRVKV